MTLNYFGTWGLSKMDTNRIVKRDRLITRTAAPWPKKAMRYLAARRSMGGSLCFVRRFFRPHRAATKMSRANKNGPVG